MSVRDLAAAVAHAAAGLHRHQAHALARMIARSEGPPNAPPPSMDLGEERDLALAALRAATGRGGLAACEEDMRRAREWTADHGKWSPRIAAEAAVLALHAAGCVGPGAARRDDRRWTVQTWQRMTWAWRTAVGPLPPPSAPAASLFDPPDPRTGWAVSALPAAGGAAEALQVRAAGPVEAAAAAADLLAGRPGGWLLRAAGLSAAVMQGRVLACAGLPAPAVLIPCGAHKQPSAARADELYTGQQFRLGLRCARALTDPPLVWIVSAEHGVVPADRVLEPYERRMRDDGVTVRPTDPTDPAVAAAVNRRPLVVSLLPAAYGRAAAAAGVRVDVRALDGAAGIGYQRGVLAGLAAAAADVRDPAGGPGEHDDPLAARCGPPGEPEPGRGR